MTTSNFIRAALVVAAFAGFTTANAQDQIDRRWEPWIGCWQPSLSSSSEIAGVVCVRPTSNRAVVEIVSVDSGKIVAHDTIDASGERREMKSQHCTGWRTGEFSKDFRRVYLKSELTCPGNFVRASSGMFAMSPMGDWLDLQSASVGENSAVRAARYREVGSWMTSQLPGELAGMIRPSGAFSSARLIASSSITGKDVIDAVQHVDTTVVQAWIVERGQSFDVDAKMLVSLERGGVPGSVTDVIVGVSYPNRFSLRNGDSKAVAMTSEPYTGRNRVRDSRFDSCMSMYDPFYGPYYGNDPCGFRYSYRYSPYYGYGSYGYGYGGYYGGGYYAPVIVVTKPERPHGTVVNGQGYVRGRASGSSSSGDDASSSSDSRSSSRAPAPSSTTGRASGSSGSGSSGKSSGSSSGSSSSGRTAQTRGKGQ